MGGIIEMNEVILIILIIVGYFIGMFISRILVTIYDHMIDPSLRLDDYGLIVVLLWFAAIPLFLLIWFLVILYQAGDNIGNSIWKRLRGNKK